MEMKIMLLLFLLFFSINANDLDEIKSEPENIVTLKLKNRPEICYLPADVGLCRAAFQSYYFDDSKNNCVKFIWGGCEGNQNNFKTYNECKKICML